MKNLKKKLDLTVILLYKQLYTEVKTLCLGRRLITHRRPCENTSEFK